MKHENKLSKEQQLDAAQENQQQQVVKEFATTDELLRADVAQTVVPPEIAQRLKQSISNMPLPARRSWWKNLLGQ